MTTLGCVTRRRGVEGPPGDYAVSGQWPDCDLADDAPLGVRYALVISRMLREAVDDRNVVEVAEKAALARSTIYDIIAGRTFPDVVSLAKLEWALETRLWPEWSEVR